MESNLQSKTKLIEKYKEVKVKDCLKIAGDAHKFQILMIISFAFFTFFLGFQYYMFPYIFFEPSYECLIDERYSTCTKEEACSKGVAFRMKSGNFYSESLMILN